MNKEYKKKNADRLRIQGYEYKSKNPEKWKLYDRLKAREYYKKNPEKVKRKNKKWNDLNTDSVKAYRQLYKKNNKEKIKIKDKKYRYDNKERINARERSYSNELHASYIKTTLRKTGIKNHAPEIVEEKRLCLQIKRKIKQLKKQNPLL